MDKITATTFAGLELPTPIIIGSSGLTNTPEKNRDLEKAGAGAVILKSLFEEQIVNESNFIQGEQDHPEAADYINKYFAEEQINNYLDLIKDTKALCTIPVIASVNCYKNDSWIDFAKQIEEAGADALELNIFFLNTAKEGNPTETEETYIRITRKVVEQINIPVIVKIGKYCSHIVNLVDRIYAAGAAAVVLFNRFYPPDIDIHKVQITSGHVFSSHQDISDTLRWTGIVNGQLPNVPIISCTGVQDWEDVIKCILSGATAVQVVSTIYQHGYELLSQMVRSLEEWMNVRQFESVEAFRGKLNYANTEDSTIYERTQFMRYFSNRD